MHEEPEHSEYELIGCFCREGLKQAGAGQYDEAVANYFAAWELLPEPRERDLFYVACMERGKGGGIAGRLPSSPAMPQVSLLLQLAPALGQLFL